MTGLVCARCGDTDGPFVKRPLRMLCERCTLISSVRPHPTEFSVSVFHEDDMNALVFEITVRYRGGGRWAVQRGEHACLGADGVWAAGVKPYERGEDWLEAHRFDLPTALRLAREAAPGVVVNGVTAAEVLRRRGGA